MTAKAKAKAKIKDEKQHVETPWLKSYPSHVRWQKQYPAESLHDMLDATVRRYGDKNAIDFLDKHTTYNELGDLTDRFAKGLQSLGIKRGDRVALLLPNTPYAVIAYYGILKAGGVVVNLNPLYAPHEIEHKIKDSNTRIVVTVDLDLTIDKLEPLLETTPLEKIIICSMADAMPRTKSLLFSVAKRRDLARVEEDVRHINYDHVIENDGKWVRHPLDPYHDAAVIQYTGGTTGVPKGAVLSHANLRINVEQCLDWFPDIQSDNEKFLAVLPLFHVFAMTVAMNFSLRIGAELVLLPRFELLDVLKTIYHKKITLFPAVPTIFTAINNYKKRDKYDLSSIRFCLSGGAPLPLDVKETFEELTGCKLSEGYGLSETSPVATVNPLDETARTGSIGLPLPDTYIEIVDLDDTDKLLPIGESGEICIRGPQVMLGYHDNKAATKESMKGGRFHTGDIGYIDEDGYTFIVDRLKDMIIAGGFNIYPRNVEEVIYTHPDIAECVVGGVPHPYRGETVKAWVTLKEGKSLTEKELKSFLKGKLSPIEMPKQIEFRDEELPKTLIGKLSRKTLVDEEKAKIAAEIKKDGKKGKKPKKAKSPAKKKKSKNK